MSIFYVGIHALILNKDKKCIITKRSKINDYMPLKWDLPGGTVEAGETVEETLLREVREETNLNIKPLYPIYVYNNLDQLPIRQTIQIVYLCECLDENNDVIRLNSLEHEEYKWIDFSELNRFDCIAFLNNLYHHCQTTLENIH